MIIQDEVYSSLVLNNFILPVGLTREPDKTSSECSGRLINSIFSISTSNKSMEVTKNKDGKMRNSMVEQ